MEGVDDDPDRSGPVVEDEDDTEEDEAEEAEGAPRRLEAGRSVTAGRPSRLPEGDEALHPVVDSAADTQLDGTGAAHAETESKDDSVRGSSTDTDGAHREDGAQDPDVVAVVVVVVVAETADSVAVPPQRVRFRDARLSAVALAVGMTGARAALDEGTEGALVSL